MGAHSGFPFDQPLRSILTPQFKTSTALLKGHRLTPV
jgi:hypothetical protein